MLIKVILPLPLKDLFSYTVPSELEEKVQVGVRVAVPFGRSKIYAGIVAEILSEISENDCVRHNTDDTKQIIEFKDIISVLDDKPILSNVHLNFWKWVAQYYMCNIGEVMSVALPSGFKLNNDTKVIINPFYDGDISNLNEKQICIVEALTSKDELSLDDISKLTNLKKVFPIIKTLRANGIILIKEELTERYKEKKEAFIKLNVSFESQDEGNISTSLKELIAQLEKKAFKQLEVILSYLKLSNNNTHTWIKKSQLLMDLPDSGQAISSLQKKGIFDIEYFGVERNIDPNLKSIKQNAEINLSVAQNKALEEIKAVFEKQNVCLLHGITSSGKTEIYVKLIKECIESGKQVLYLLPEIALTAQMIVRLKRFFGDDIGVYHSKYNEHEKIEIWNKTNSKYKILLGARSALFLPFNNLGLIIVDEEHETSYKQQDPAPRYHARDAAIFLASMHNAKTLLGSATPSIESYYNALNKKYGLVNLFTRYNDVKLPDIWFSNLKQENTNKSMKGHLSSFMFEKMEKALEKGQQIILFQNRRGFSTMLECEDCSFTPSCENCDVTLTYHKRINSLNCHYCGYSNYLYQNCPQCGGFKLKFKGFGTEKIEDDLKILFPEAKVARMDMDSTRSKNAFFKIINSFENRDIDILVGTQMVTKGLDFENVALVGILNADGLISFPDFRAHERSFHLMTQVSGRAGRKDGIGEVVLQTYKPEQEIIIDVINSDFANMYKREVISREMFKYPPFYRLIKLSIRHIKEDLTSTAADVLGISLRQCFGERVLGPEYPLVSRIQTYFIKDIMLKLERNTKLSEMKDALSSIVDVFHRDPRFKSVRLIIDVDPF